MKYYQLKRMFLNNLFKKENKTNKPQNLFTNHNLNKK